ncbi:MAG TPA: PAS domain S-box protein [Mucilaginibacter sp.]|jgi:PAS domain S-box-containing protein
MFKSLRIPFTILVTGLCWALFSGPVISFLSKRQQSKQQELFLELNDIVFVVIIALVLSFQIKRRLRKVTRSEEEYRRLFESNPNPMWIYNNETLRFVKVNDAAVEKYKYSRNMFLKMTIGHIRPEGDRDKRNDYFKERNNNDGIRLAGIWKHRKGNGETFNVSVVAHPVLFRGKNCSMVMATDMTELLEKEQKLEEAYLKIKAANDTLLQLAWSNSHEIRKPLCSILGLISLLKYTTDEQERNEFLELLEICSTELDVVLKENNEKVRKMGMRRDM